MNNEDIQINFDKVKEYLVVINGNLKQPSGSELLEELEKVYGWQIRFFIVDIINDLIREKNIKLYNLDYFYTLIDDEYEDSIINVLKNDTYTDTKQIESTIDNLLKEGQKYKNSADYIDMINFVAKFRQYSPYNNMLVKIQNPHCSFYATKNVWENNLGRYIKEDAKPMLILAPMHPVMLVYDLDQTEGKDLPKMLSEFAHFQSIDWIPKKLENLENNAKKYMIRIDYKEHSSTSAGFATISRSNNKEKMRISIHNKLDDPSRFGVLCHELAHIFLGHLGSDNDRWWPSRLNLSLSSVEVEAESVAYIVTTRLGLKSGSDSYVSSYLTGNKVPEGISIDYIAKIAAKLENMSIGSIPDPKRRINK